jgi:hypothetical protein
MTSRMSDGPGLVTEPKQPEKSLGELFSDLGREFNTLVRQELDLAKDEARQEVRRAGQAGMAFGVAALAGWVALVMLSLALAWLLDKAMDRALAFGLVGLLWLLVTLTEASMGRNRMRRVEPLPQTKQSLKEDVSWAKQQLT